MTSPPRMLFFFFNDTATTEIYTLSLHDALPISLPAAATQVFANLGDGLDASHSIAAEFAFRSEEHTSELQSQSNLVCRLLLEKKNSALPTGTLMMRPVRLTSSPSLLSVYSPSSTTPTWSSSRFMAIPATPWGKDSSSPAMTLSRP